MGLSKLVRRLMQAFLMSKRIHTQGDVVHSRNTIDTKRRRQQICTCCCCAAAFVLVLLVLLNAQLDRSAWDALQHSCCCGCLLHVCTLVHAQLPRTATMRM